MLINTAVNVLPIPQTRCGQQSELFVLMRLLCSKIHPLRYARVLQTMLSVIGHKLNKTHKKMYILSDYVIQNTRVNHSFTVLTLVCVVACTGEA